MDIYQYPSHFGHVGAYVSPLYSTWLHLSYRKTSCAPHGSTGTLRNHPALRMASPEISETALRSAWLHRSSPKPSCTAHGSTGTVRNRPALRMTTIKPYE